ncbi:hypothetical protein [Streptomyces melanogenes]|uniref:hypothetical protein n=1 Tax=Streptomyces melanogenes TaxID=67326 RepID=UPI0037901629
MKTDYAENCGSARRRFADELRILLGRLPHTAQSAMARQLGLPTSTLSCYWSGRRVPSAADAELIYRGVHRVTGAEVRAEGLGAFLTLRTGAAARRPRQAIPLQRALARQGSGSLPPRDRRTRRSETARQTADVLAAKSLAGHQREVVSLAWTAGQRLSPEALADTVAELVAHGQADIAEAVTLSGRHRSPHDVMGIALAFLNAELPDFARLAMTAAVSQKTS